VTTFPGPSPCTYPSPAIPSTLSLHHSVGSLGRHISSGGRSPPTDATTHQTSPSSSHGAVPSLPLGSAETRLATTSVPPAGSPHQGQLRPLDSQLTSSSRGRDTLVRSRPVAGTRTLCRASAGARGPADAGCRPHTSGVAGPTLRVARSSTPHLPPAARPPSQVCSLAPEEGLALHGSHLPRPHHHAHVLAQGHGVPCVPHSEPPGGHLVSSREQLLSRLERRRSPLLVRNQDEQGRDAATGSRRSDHEPGHYSRRSGDRDHAAQTGHTPIRRPLQTHPPDGVTQDAGFPSRHPTLSTYGSQEYYTDPLQRTQFQERRRFETVVSSRARSPRPPSAHAPPQAQIDQFIDIVRARHQRRRVGPQLAVDSVHCFDDDSLIYKPAYTLIRRSRRATLPTPAQRAWPLHAKLVAPLSLDALLTLLSTESADRVRALLHLAVAQAARAPPSADDLHARFQLPPADATVLLSAGAIVPIQTPPDLNLITFVRYFSVAEPTKQRRRLIMWPSSAIAASGYVSSFSLASTAQYRQAVHAVLRRSF
jgi:hypothetical protein